jgi:hypothetical protein
VAEQESALRIAGQREVDRGQRVGDGAGARRRAIAPPIAAVVEQDDV